MCFLQFEKVGNGKGWFDKIKNEWGWQCWSNPWINPCCPLVNVRGWGMVVVKKGAWDDLVIKKCSAKRFCQRCRRKGGLGASPKPGPASAGESTGFSSGHRYETLRLHC